MLLRNEIQRRILFAESGLDSWHSAAVACAIMRRISRAGATIAISETDVAVINRMAAVLKIGKRYRNPGFGQYPIKRLEVPTYDILAVFN